MDGSSPRWADGKGAAATDQLRRKFRREGTYLVAAPASRHQLRAVFSAKTSPTIDRFNLQPSNVPYLVLHLRCFIGGHEESWSLIMINAFLVFNGQGQPRLTKFYTQLVCYNLPGCCHKLTMRPVRKRAYNSASFPKSLLSSRTAQLDPATSCPSLLYSLPRALLTLHQKSKTTFLRS